MNTHNIINSIYNPKKKSKELIFPKIAKPQPLSLGRNLAQIGRKYRQGNIFEPQPQPQANREAQWSRQREQLELRIAQLGRKHQEDLLLIGQRQQNVGREIEMQKQTQYQIKLTLWELRNEIMDLGNMLMEEEVELARLTAGQGQYQQLEDNFDQQQEVGLEQEEEEEERYGERYEEEEEEGSSSVLRRLSQEETHFDLEEI